MLLNPRPVPSASLSWSPEIRAFVGEMSDIGGFGRVWDDACDYGLTLVSSRFVGEECVMVVNHEERDREGDLLWYDLVPAGQIGPAPAGSRRKFGVRIYND